MVKTDSILLSIIIPAYNVEEYIERCLSSILKQDASEDKYEVIIVNDGSTDRTLSIIEEHAGLHKNIKIFTQENKGTGMSRNKGLACASGKYVWFIDADDWIQPGSISFLISSVERSDIELLRFDYKKVNEYVLPAPLSPETNPSITFFKPTDIFRKKIKRKFFLFCFLFRRDTIVSRNIAFPDLRMCEDVPFLTSYVCFVKKIAYVNCEFYYYYNRPGSMVNTFSLSHAKDILSAYALMQRTLESLPKNYKLDYYIRKVIMIRIIDVFRESKRRLSREEIIELTEFFEKNELYKFSIVVVGVSLRKILLAVRLKYNPASFYKIVD